MDDSISPPENSFPAGINPLLWAMIVSQIQKVVNREIAPVADEVRDLNNKMFIGNGHDSFKTQLALLNQRLATIERIAVFFGAPLVVAIVGLVVAILTHRVFP